MINKFRYLLSGNTVSPEYRTGAMFSDTVIANDCPKCKCTAGFYCQTSNGRKVWPPHMERGTPPGDMRIYQIGSVQRRELLAKNESQQNRNDA